MLVLHLGPFFLADTKTNPNFFIFSGWMQDVFQYISKKVLGLRLGHFFLKKVKVSKKVGLKHWRKFLHQQNCPVSLRMFFFFSLAKVKYCPPFYFDSYIIVVFFNMFKGRLFFLLPQKALSIPKCFYWETPCRKVLKSSDFRQQNGNEPRYLGKSWRAFF